MSSINPKNGFRRENLPILLAAGALLAAAWSLKPEYALAKDALVKYIQAFSLLKNGFSTADIFYPARSLDSRFAYYPFEYVVAYRGEYLSVFPWLLAAFSAPLIRLGGPAILPVTGVFFLY